MSQSGEHKTIRRFVAWFVLAAVIGCETLPPPIPTNPKPVDPTTSTPPTDPPATTQPVERMIPQVPPSGAALGQLQSASAVKPFIAFDGRVPSFVEVEIPVPAGTGTDAVTGALSFLEKYKDLYRLEEPASQLFLSRFVSDPTGDHMFFGQQRDGIVVNAAELAVHVRNGVVLGTNGHYLPELPAYEPEMIDAEAAIQMAAGHAGSSPAEAASVPTLVYFDPNLLGAAGERTHLAWRLSLKANCGTAGGCANLQYFVDAHTGEILWFEDPNIYCDKDFDINTANNTWSTTCWNLPWETADDEWFDEDGVWCGIFEGCAQPSADGWSAFRSAHRTYDYFAGTFGRCGWDADDAQLEAMVHVAIPNGPNAAYNRGCDHVRFSNGMVTLDIFAHEYTHAVTRWTAGLGNSFQSGAINEHYSDVFASMLDGNWTIGEGSAAGVLRTMSNPPAQGHPDHMTAAQSPAGIGFQNLPAGNDNGGVHINNGILNKACVLVTDGGTHAGITVRGIGREKMARLFYNVLTGRLTSGSQFADVRNNTVALARHWWNRNEYGFTRADVCSVINAYAAVGLGARDLDCDGLDDNEDPDDDGDYVPDFRDNCPTVKNPYQENNDGDAQGDACDNDDDNDGVADNVDNCPFTFNPNQSDRDGDGRGDVCDNCPDFVEVYPGPDGRLRRYADPNQTDTDRDGRGDLCDDDDDNDGIPDYADNCPKVRNPDQRDLNGDGIGFACDKREQEPFRRKATPKDWFKIDPCVRCGPWLHDRVRTRIRVDLPQYVAARIVDDAGNVVGKARKVFNNDGIYEWSFDFKPRASSLYRFPETATRNLGGLEVIGGRPAIQATGYFVEVYAETADPMQAREPYNISVEHVGG